MGEDALSKAKRDQRATSKYGDMAKQADNRVQPAKTTRVRKANSDIDPERLSRAIRYLKEHPK
jgi:hypothetical protein